MKAILAGLALGAVVFTVWMYHSSPTLFRALAQPGFMPPVFTNPRNEP